MLEHGFLDEMHALRRDYPQLHARYAVYALRGPTVRLGIISKAKPIVTPLSKKALSPHASLPNAS